VEAAVDALLEHWQSVATEPPGEYVSDLAASARHWRTSWRSWPKSWPASAARNGVEASGSRSRCTWCPVRLN